MRHFWIGWSWRDWAVPGALLIWAQYEVWVGGSRVTGQRGVFALVAVAACGALLWRRTRPLTVLLAMSVILLAPEMLDARAESGAQVLMLVVGVFACGRYGTRPYAYLALLIGSILVAAESILNPNENLRETWTWTLNTLWIFALGAAFRHERRLRDEASAAAEQRHRADAAEQRLRIARELHDIFAHSLSVMVVQAEVADTFFSSQPERSRIAIGQVSNIGRSALADTRRLVGELREPGADPPPMSGPGLADVPALVERVRASGLPVTLQIAPELPPVANQVTETVYRIIQESLTNAIRHAGPVATRVDLSEEHGSLVVDIHDDGAGEGVAPGGGHGLVGMRERAQACGGDLTAGPSPAGGFHVRAVLPTLGTA